MAKSVLVIGGGPAGLAAADGLKSAGCEVILVEKEERLGGTPVKGNYFKLSPDLALVDDVINPLVDSVEGNGVKIHINSRITEISGSAPNFKVVIEDGVETEVGAIILATGFEHFNPSSKLEYNYGVYPDVITGLELEDMLNPDGKTNGRLLRPSDKRLAKRIAFVQCVGSRDRQVDRNFCCRVGCIVATKQAIEIKENYKDAEVYIFYMDIRSYGKGWEELYWKAQEDYQVRYIRGRVGEVNIMGDSLMVRAEDSLMSRPLELIVDMVVLTTGIAPSEGTKQMCKILNLKVDKDMFPQPVTRIAQLDASAEGIFLAGTVSGPKMVEDCIIEGQACATRAISFLNRE